MGDTTFRKLGLWQVCIAGFRNPKNYWGKVFYGCWWIFAREYNGLRNDGILTPRKLKRKKSKVNQSLSFIQHGLLLYKHLHVLV